MDEAPSPEAAPPGSRLKTALLMAGGAIAVGLLVGGVVIFVTADSSQQAAAPAASGFDVTELPKTRAPEGPSVLPQQAPSSLTMVPKLGLGAQTGAAAAPQPEASPLEQAAAGFRQAIRSSEKTLGDLARDYTRRYPSIQQYGREWMSYPDLKKLNDDYMRDHDPIAFLRGLAVSPSFPKMLGKYAGEPAIRGFVQEAVTKAPAGAVGASMSYINQDKTVDTLVQNVAGRVGLPPGLLQASQAAVHGPNPPDMTKIAEQAMKGMQLPAAPGSDGRR